jgi:RING-box protein 1
LLILSLFQSKPEAPTKAASPTSATSAPRFEIKKWNAVAMWSWDICADTVRIYMHISFFGEDK